MSSTGEPLGFPDVVVKVAVSHETKLHNDGQMACGKVVRALHDGLAPSSFILQCQGP